MSIIGNVNINPKTPRTPKGKGKSGGGSKDLLIKVGGAAISLAFTFGYYKIKENYQKRIDSNRAEVRRSEEELRHKHKMEEEDLKHRHNMEKDEQRYRQRQEERNAAYEREKKKKEEEEQKAQENLSETEKKKIRDQEVKDKVIKILGLNDDEPPKEEPLVKDPKPTNVPYVQEYLIPKLICPGDISVLVSPPGKGKSILGVQFGIEIAGERICELFPRKDTAKAGHRVLYYDAEMETNERVQRYGNIKSPDLLSWFHTKGTSTVYYFLDYCMDRIAKYSGDITIVLDNISAIFPKLTDEDAVNLYKGFKTLQIRGKDNGRDITFILVTHTTKSFSGEPDLSDVAGTVYLTRFAKTVIAISSHSKIPELSVLSVIKCRNGKETNPKYTLKKVEEPYLHFELVCDGIYEEGTSTTSDEKKDQVPKEKEKRLTDEQIQEAREMVKNGATKMDVARHFGISRPTLDKYLKE